VPAPGHHSLRPAAPPRPVRLLAPRARARPRSSPRCWRSGCGARRWVCTAGRRCLAGLAWWTSQGQSARRRLTTPARSCGTAPTSTSARDVGRAPGCRAAGAPRACVAAPLRRAGRLPAGGPLANKKSRHAQWASPSLSLSVPGLWGLGSVEARERSHSSGGCRCGAWCRIMHAAHVSRPPTHNPATLRLRAPGRCWRWPTASMHLARARTPAQRTSPTATPSSRGA
jgi:hypothetical protein